MNEDEGARIAAIVDDELSAKDGFNKRNMNIMLRAISGRDFNGCAPASLCFVHIKHATSQTLYRVSDDVVDVARRLKVKDKIPVFTGLLLVPLTIEFRVDGKLNSVFFLPRKELPRSFGFLLKEVPHNNPVQLFAELRDSWINDFDIQGVGIILRDGEAILFRSDRMLRENLEESIEMPFPKDGDGGNVAEVFRILNALSLLLKAQGAPIVSTEKRSCLRKVTKKEPALIQIEHHVKLAPNRIQYTSSDATEPLDTTGRVLADTAIVGHVRNQACGPKHSERRLIYVAEYVGKRWRAPSKVVNVSM